MKSPEQNTYAPRPELGAGALRVARFTKAHGLKGGLKLELYTDAPDKRFVKDAIFYLQVPRDSVWYQKSITLRDFRYMQGKPVAFFHEIHDRTAAESAVRSILWIDEETAQALQEENAWFDRDLKGLSAYIGERKIGVVAEVQHLPGQDLLRVEVESTGKSVLVPFVEAIVPQVDMKAKKITLTPPQGLFEEDETKE